MGIRMEGNRKVISSKNLPQVIPQIIEQVSYRVSYPILMYDNLHPLDNKLTVVNLAVNCPQMRIDIYPYRFLCFVKSGINEVAGFK
jgi:hypothetical protein